MFLWIDGGPKRKTLKEEKPHDVLLRWTPPDLIWCKMFHTWGDFSRLIMSLFGQSFIRTWQFSCPGLITPLNHINYSNSKTQIYHLNSCHEYQNLNRFHLYNNLLVCRWIFVQRRMFICITIDMFFIYPLNIWIKLSLISG